jgi:Type I restriction modification DNA specificity domain
MTQQLDALFDVGNGHELDLVTLDLSEPSDPDSVAYVSRLGRKNGVSAYVKPLDDVAPAAAGTLTIALGGTYAAATFVQPRPYYTAQNVRVLTPKYPMTNQERLWWALCIQHNRFRFGYGRHANRTFKQLALPTDLPAWVQTTPIPDLSPLQVPTSSTATPPLDSATWDWVQLDQIFKVVRGRYVPVAEKAPGDTPEVSSSASRNGISRWIDLPAEHSGGVITVARNGSVGQAFYQRAPFFATDDVHVFYPLEVLSPESLLFVCVLIRRERYRFNYGRKWSLDGMRSANIRLPITSDGEPNWAWIDKYVSTLPFSAAATAGPGRGHCRPIAGT